MPKAPAALMLGATPSQLPFGQCLLLTPPLLSLSGLTDANGQIFYKIPIVNALPIIGVSIYFQGVVIDSHLPSIFSITRGMEAGIGL